MSLHVFNVGSELKIVTNECGTMIDPSKINDNDKLLTNLKIGDKVKWTSSRCVSGGYGLSCCGGQGRVFDITDNHVYVCSVGVIISTISGFRKSSLMSLGFVHIDNFKFSSEDRKYSKICDQFDNPWTSNYEDYELFRGNTLRYKYILDSENARRLRKIGYEASDEYIESGEKYDYFLSRDMYGKPSMVTLFEKGTRPSEYHFTKMTCFDL